MRKLIIVAGLAFAAAVSLTACNKQDDAQQDAQATAQKQVAKPTDPNDTQAWSNYFQQIVLKNEQGMSADQPYPYFVPAGDSDDAKAQRDRQLQNVQDTISRGVVPGNLLVFAGPDSGKTADLVVTAFKDAKPGSFKGVILLFIGDKADEQRVDDALKPTGATVRFAQM